MCLLGKFEAVNVKPWVWCCGRKRRSRHPFLNRYLCGCLALKLRLGVASLCYSTLFFSFPAASESDFLIETILDSSSQYPLEQL